MLISLQVERQRLRDRQDRLSADLELSQALSGEVALLVDGVHFNAMAGGGDV